MAYEVLNPRLSFEDGSVAYAGDVLTEDELLEKAKYKYVLKHLLDRGHIAATDGEVVPSDEPEEDDSPDEGEEE